MDAQAEAPPPAPHPLDALVWTSLWLGAANATALAAAAHAMQIPFDPRLGALAFCGTVAVYGRDHLVDRAPDRAGFPRRTAFLERHAAGMRLWCLACLGVALVLGAWAGAAVVLLAACALTLGLLHRRLKKQVWSKPLYVALAWTTVVVGFPAAANGEALHVGLVAGVMGCTAAANVLLYNLRPGRTLRALWGERGGRLLALAFLLCAVGLSVGGPPPVERLVWMPIALLPMLALRPLTERRVAWLVDGALLAGALLCLLLPFP